MVPGRALALPFAATSAIAEVESSVIDKGGRQTGVRGCEIRLWTQELHILSKTELT